MRRVGGTQGEALAVWAMWTVVLATILVTYWRLEPDTADATDDLYHVSGNGIVGGLSRVLVELNFPVALVAILVVLVALDALSSAAWALAGLAIALCAVLIGFLTLPLVRVVRRALRWRAAPESVDPTT